MTIVKICGITNIDDARAAIDAGADMLGFIFYPPSPRYVTPEQARNLVFEIRNSKFEIKVVGVFVNESLEHLRAVMETAALDLAQLHGRESPEMVRELGTRAYKSIQATDLDTARTVMANYRASVNGNLPAFIADAPPAKLPGGNGTVADWSVAREIAKAFPILLAGGLNPENVRAAIELVQPFGVDVSSGVERAPGLKDHVKVREFINQVKR
ncbi:MAG: phosphoribosylanthranilate isomerase [Chloroflexota bacterium]|nr:MAG: phosphoribosylanthranilate isomerase [Chloroflexota bacterium]